MRETVRTDFVGNGVEKRFALSGVDCRLKDAAEQETPVGLATAVSLVAPSAAPALTVLASGGSIAAGIYYLAVAYTETVGSGTGYTAPSALATVIVPSGSVNRIQATWTAPSTATSPTAGSELYCSPSSSNADIVQAAATSGSTATATLTALPVSTVRPLVDYKTLFPTYNPLPSLEQDIAVDGTASVGTATLNLTTAPSLFDRFRVVYDRKPAIPVNDGDTVAIEQGEIRLVALMFAASKCLAMAEVGDSTLLNAIYQTANAAVTQMQRMATPVLRARPRLPDPRSSLT
jgi:hypothetical protein